jgi:hypothetical protein
LGTIQSFAYAQSSPSVAAGAEPKSAAVEEDSDGIGLNIDFEFASAYIFRGQNLFREADDKESRQFPRFSPALAWEVLGSGVTVSYWGAFQLGGGNTSQNIDAGWGAEQDLSMRYEREILPSLTLAAGLVSYLYPFAKKDAAGATFPAWLDPALAVTYNALVDLALNVSFMFGIQSVFSDEKYLYINPTIGKSIALSGDSIALDLLGGFGLKIFPHQQESHDNRFDILIAAASRLPVWKNTYARPNVNLSWTNRENRGFNYEVGFWGGLNLGADF